MHHAVRAFATAAILALVAIAALEFKGRVQAESLVSKLLVADTSHVSAIIQELDLHRYRTARELDRIASDPKRSSKERLHASLALLPASGEFDNYLLDRLLAAEPQELFVIVDRLQTRRAAFTERLWAVARNAGTDRKQKLRAARACLARPSGRALGTTGR